MRDLLVIILFLLTLVLQARAAGPDVTVSASLRVSVRITSPMGRTGTPVRSASWRRFARKMPRCPGPCASRWTDNCWQRTPMVPPMWPSGWTKTPSSGGDHRRSDRFARSRRYRSRGARAVRSHRRNAGDERAGRSVRAGQAGRAIKSVPLTQFTILEDGVPQQVDLAQQEALGVTFALLIDSSRSTSVGSIRPAHGGDARRLHDALDRNDVAPFSTGWRVTGPTDDRKTLNEAIGSVASTGGTAISTRRGTLEQARQGGGPPRHRPHHRRLRRAQHVVC